MKLVVGLGNPGSEYNNTRHNIGFQLLDYIAKKKNIEFLRNKFNGEYADFFVDGEKIILLKTLLYISGEVVQSFVSFYKINLDDILVIQDDLDMDFGRIKIIYDSGSGGHNGIRDIEKCLGSKKFVRLKIGISNDKSIDTKDYVLGKFTEEERDILQLVDKKLVNIIDDFCTMNLVNLMNKYNHK